MARGILPASLLLGGIVLTAMPAAAQGEADTIRELRRQMQLMQRRLDQLEARQRQDQRAAQARPDPPPAPARPGAAAGQAGITGPVLPQGAQPQGTGSPGTQPTGAQPPGAQPQQGGQGQAVVSGPAAPPPPQGAQQPGPQAATLGTLPGSFRIPGTDTSVRLYGFAVGILTRDFEARNRSDVVTAQSIPLSPSAASRQGGEALFSGRRSRIGIETATSTDWGPFRTVIEFDFAGSQSTASLQSQSSSNSYIPRLRLAFGELGPFMAGQNWSLFYDDAYPQRLDYSTPFATSNVRQAGFRYTHQFGGGLSLAGSVEQPYTDTTFSGGVRYADVETGTAPPLTLDKTPDLLVRLHWQEPSVGSVSLTGLLRPEMEVTNASTSGSGAEYRRSTTGWGFQLAAMLHVAERDRAFLRFVYGEGVGRYLDSTANGQGTVTNAGLAGVAGEQVRINAPTLAAALLGYTHYWTPTVRSNATMGWASLSYPDYARGFAAAGAGLLNREIGQGVVNLIWSPIPRVDVGIEYLGSTRLLLRGIPASATAEAAKGGVSHRALVSATFRF